MNDKIELHNNLIRHTFHSMTRLSSIDQRVVAYLVAVGIRNPKGDQMPETVEGSVNDLAKIAGITGGNIYRQVREATESLMRQLIRFRDPDTGKDVSTTWLADSIYSQGDGTFVVGFSKSMQKVLTELTKHRTVLELETILGIGGSNYAVRLYQIAKSWQSEQYWTTQIDVLRDQLGVPPGSYKAPKDFRRYALDYPIEIINRKTDIELSYHKANKGRRWTDIAFHVKQQAKSQSQREQFFAAQEAQRKAEREKAEQQHREDRDSAIRWIAQQPQDEQDRIWERLKEKGMGPSSLSLSWVCQYDLPQDESAEIIDF